MVGTQAIKSKGAYNERVNREPNPALKNGHQRKEYRVQTTVPMEVDIAFVIVGDINISRDSVDCFEASQRRF